METNDVTHCFLIDGKSYHYSGEEIKELIRKDPLKESHEV